LPFLAVADKRYFVKSNDVSGE
jgi:hypothetical protein